VGHSPPIWYLLFAGADPSFSGWGPAQFNVLWSKSTEDMKAIIGMMVQEVKSQNLDGLVLEVGFLSYREDSREGIMRFMKSLSKQLREISAKFILVIPVREHC